MATLINEKSITIMYGPVINTIQKGHKKYEKVLEMVKRGDDEKDITDYLESLKPENALPRGFRILEGRLQVSSEGDWMETPAAISKRVLWMLEEGINPDPVLAFYVRLRKNPSYTSQQELFRFLEANNLPITKEGKFMAYKRVTGDFKDCHTRSIDNSVGSVVKMPRSEVDDDSSNTCSSGLHVCSREYLKSFHGEGLVSVEIDPEHVVSVPTDYNNTKMRVCQYKVVERLPMDLVLKDKDYWEAPVV